MLKIQQNLCKAAALKKDQKLVFKNNYRLMQVRSIAECSKWSILQYFQPSLSYQLLLRSLFCLFLSGRFTQVLLYNGNHNIIHSLPGHVAQSVGCLATDAYLTADPGVASLIHARSHTFVENDFEIISMVILLPPLNHSRRVVASYKRKYVHEVLDLPLVQACPGKSVVR